MVQGRREVGEFRVDFRRIFGGSARRGRGIAKRMDVGRQERVGEEGGERGRGERGGGREGRKREEKEGFPLISFLSGDILSHPFLHGYMLSRWMDLGREKGEREEMNSFASVKLTSESTSTPSIFPEASLLVS